MSKPTLTVEIEVDENSNLQPFFTLDDATAGVLDNTEFPLGGLTFFDVSQYVAGVSVSRGISRELERFTAGQASVALKNDTRLFDPLNTASPYAEQLLPHRQLRIQANGTPVYLGIVADWNFQYDLTGNNLSIANCVDKFRLLSQQYIEEQYFPEELPGARTTRVLDLNTVNWSSSERDIDSGHVLLAAGTVAAMTNVLDYLNIVATTEDGNFFIGSDGYATLQDGLTGPSSVNIVTFSSEGDGVPFTDIDVVYGSELLYNRIEVTSAPLQVQVTAEDLDSQDLYGITTLTKDNLLQANVEDITSLAVGLLNRYNEPEYRFERIGVDITELAGTTQTKLLNIDLTDAANIKFQPNNVGDVINKYAQIIGIKHNIDSKRHRMEFNFRTLDYAPFVLDDPVFGVLGGTLNQYLGASEETYEDNTTSYDATIPYTGTIPNSGIGYDANIEYDGSVVSGNRLG